jgi:hypothetical protein
VALISLLKAGGEVTVLGSPILLADLVVSVGYLPLLVGVGLWMWSEARGTAAAVGDREGHHWALARWARRWTLGPHVSLPASGVESISVWPLVGGGVLAGFLSGFLGVGGGFVLLPMLVYVVGARTVVAVATTLFQVVLVAAVGAFLHGRAGNIDAFLVLWVLVGGIVGAQVGATFTRYASGPRIRRYFAYLALIAAVLVAHKLAVKLTG